MHPILPLAISMHANKGIYALLLGSGISRAAEVPTGWEVQLDLIRRVARLEGEHCDPYPAEWYAVRHGEPPNYSKLLGTLAKTPAERSRLLREYFEPTEEERERGVKLPTAAHRAIAELVKRGYVRVVVTTNFDRLLEQAIENVGIVPTAIPGGTFCGECFGTPDCVTLYPGVPGVRCTRPSETGCCAPSISGGGGECVAPCPG